MTVEEVQNIIPPLYLILWKAVFEGFTLSQTIIGSLKNTSLNCKYRVLIVI